MSASLINFQLSFNPSFKPLSAAHLPKCTPWRTNMGIKGLTKLLCEHAPRAITEHKLEDYSGCKIAIDASVIIYQFLIVVGRNGTTLLTNQAGEVTSHLQGMFTRTTRLIEAGLQPVYVFDGQPPSLKDGVLAKRDAAREDAAMDLAAAVQGCNNSEIGKLSKRTVKLTKRHVEDCRKLLHLMGIPIVEAPSEAEAECAALCKSGKVYAVASEDMDLLPFGAPRFLRHLMEPLSRKSPVLEFSLAKVLDELDLTMDQLIDLCIFCGCDYIDNIRGIGPQKALKLICQYGNIETALMNLNMERYKVPHAWPYQQVRHLFKFPEVISAEGQPDFELIAPHEEELRAFLVEENSFNSARVIKAIEKLKAAEDRYSTSMKSL